MKVAVLDDYHGAFLEAPPVLRLRQRATVVVHTRQLALTERQTALAGVEAIIALRERTRFDAAFFQDASDLRLISQTGGVGPHLDLEAATRAGVLVATARLAGSPSTVELTFGLILAVMRRIPQSDRAIREGRWETPYGRTLTGKTLGIVGLGRIGTEVARVAQAFGMQVVAWGRRLTLEHAAQVGVRAVSLEELLASADVVSVHLALNAGTRGLLDATKLRLMRPEAYFINTARGAIVDEAALVELLREGRIAGAGLDVFAEEPLPADSPLRALDNVVLTPHAGWPADSSYAGFADAAVRNIEAYMDGAPANVVNPEAAGRREASQGTR
ncbi:MAG: D-2-hydroxyacid dehydrogenase family protein [Chloroflexi bacterium]|nr:D-2-hydroxyacid dehydrogenase family protein [Chloroflexota bacterium]